MEEDVYKVTLQKAGPMTDRDKWNKEYLAAMKAEWAQEHPVTEMSVQTDPAPCDEEDQAAGEGPSLTAARAGVGSSGTARKRSNALQKAMAELGDAKRRRDDSGGAAASSSTDVKQEPIEKLDFDWPRESERAWDFRRFEEEIRNLMKDSRCCATAPRSP